MLTTTTAEGAVSFEKSKFTVQTAVRLAKYFGQTPDYWLDLQKNADLQEAAKDKKLTAVLGKITKAKKQPATVAKKQSAIVAKKGTSVKKATLADKRKQAAKAPGSKTTARKKR